MGTTEKPFHLYEGHATNENFKTGPKCKFKLKELEKAVVSYSNDGFTIGSHEFRYSDTQSIELASVDYLSQGAMHTFRNICIQIRQKDDLEYVLYPVAGWNLSTDDQIKRAEELFKNLNAVWEKVRLEDRKDKLQKMLAVSTRIKMDMIQRALGLDADTVSNKIFEWAAEFNFKIDGDSVVIAGGDVAGFISKLDAEFADWGKKDEKKV